MDACRLLLAWACMLVMGSCMALTAPELDLGVKERQPDTLTVNWTLSGQDDSMVDMFKIAVTDEEDNYKITFQGVEFIKRDEKMATVRVHKPNSKYNVCIEAVFTEPAKVEYGKESVITCVETSTIQVILSSSIIALTLTIGFFILVILAAVISWKCAKRSAREPEYEKTEMNGNGDLVPLNQIES